MAKKKQAPAPAPKPATQAADPLTPSLSLLVKLGSIAVHTDEFLSDDAHHFDKTALDQLLKDAEVVAWVKEMTTMAMLPVKRKA